MFKKQTNYKVNYTQSTLPALLKCELLRWIRFKVGFWNVAQSQMFKDQTFSETVKQACGSLRCCMRPDFTLKLHLTCSLNVPILINSKFQMHVKQLLMYSCFILRLDEVKRRFSEMSHFMCLRKTETGKSHLKLNQFKPSGKYMYHRF
jgi:hypothetical protein